MHANFWLQNLYIYKDLEFKSHVYTLKIIKLLFNICFYFQFSIVKLTYILKFQFLNLSYDKQFTKRSTIV